MPDTPLPCGELTQMLPSSASWDQSEMSATISSPLRAREPFLIRSMNPMPSDCRPDEATPESGWNTRTGGDHLWCVSARCIRVAGQKRHPRASSTIVVVNLDDLFRAVGGATYYFGVLESHVCDVVIELTGMEADVGLEVLGGQTVDRLCEVGRSLVPRRFPDHPRAKEAQEWFSEVKALSSRRAELVHGTWFLSEDLEVDLVRKLRFRRGRLEPSEHTAESLDGVAKDSQDLFLRGLKLMDDLFGQQIWSSADDEGGESSP